MKKKYNMFFQEIVMSPFKEPSYNSCNKNNNNNNNNNAMNVQSPKNKSL